MTGAGWPSSQSGRFKRAPIANRAGSWSPSGQGPGAVAHMSIKSTPVSRFVRFSESIVRVRQHRWPAASSKHRIDISPGGCARPGLGRLAGNQDVIDGLIGGVLVGNQQNVTGGRGDRPAGRRGIADTQEGAGRYDQPVARRVERA